MWTLLAWAGGRVERRLALLPQGNSPKCPHGSFSFWENPHAQSCHSIQGRVCPLSHSPPLQLDQGMSVSGPHTTQLSTLPSRHPQSLCVYHFVLIPFPATLSSQVSLGAAQALFGRGGSHELGSLPGVLRQAQRERAWGFSHPGPCTGPRDLLV